MTPLRCSCQTPAMAQSKDEIYFAVCNSILKYEAEKGHLQWTLSDISRDSSITRSLIYYYFGKEKSTVLEEAYKFIISKFFDVERAKTMTIHERLKTVLQDLQHMPYLFVLYYLQKNKDGDFGRMIKEAERLLLLGMKREFPDLTELQILEIYLKELGAIAYQVPPEQVKFLFSDCIKA